MLIAITGATGFLGRYIVNHLIAQWHRCRCWYRPCSDRGGFADEGKIEWVPGALNDAKACDALVRGADGVVHSALGWTGGLVEYAQTNVVGTLQLMEKAKRAGAGRFVFIASCVVHEIILDDRKLDEAHPLSPTSQYGAYKAAIEMFVHSLGLGDKWGVCSLRPTGIYGLARPVQKSQWFNLVREVVTGKSIRSSAGGKQVHAADVAKAVGILLATPVQTIAGQVYNCYDLYVADQDIAMIAKRLTDSSSHIERLNKGPKHQIDTTKIRQLGMGFGGPALFEKTIGQLVEAVRRELAS